MPRSQRFLDGRPRQVYRRQSRRRACAWQRNDAYWRTEKNLASRTSRRSQLGCRCGVRELLARPALGQSVEQTL